MQCINCGRPLRREETICPNCGEPVDYEVADVAEDTLFAPPMHYYAQGHAQGHAQDQAQGYPPDAPDTQAGGVPVDPYAPTVYGPPIKTEARTADQAIAYPAPPRQRIGGYRTVVPPASPRRRVGWLGWTAAAAALCVVALLFAGALAATGQSLPGFPLGFLNPSNHAPSHGTATTTARCALPAVNPQAARALANVQLATGVQDAAHKDLHPVDHVSAFTTGQYLYVTFQIATDQSGSIGADLCTNGNVSHGTQAVAAHSNGYLGEFNLPAPLTRANLGHGAVTLTWNGRVAAVLTFIVST